MSRRPKQNLTAFYSEMLSDYEKGLSLRNIANKFSTHQETIRRILKKHGVFSRPMSDAMKKYHEQKRNNGL